MIDGSGGATADIWGITQHAVIECDCVSSVCAAFINEVGGLDALDFCLRRNGEVVSGNGGSAGGNGRVGSQD